VRYVEAGGARLSTVGVGTWQFGASEWGYGRQYAAEIAPRILERSLDLGVNVVDTAEMYAFGRSERIVGRAIASRRDEVFVATKLLPLLPAGPVVGWRLRGSLRRLGTDHVDLYQLHWPNPAVPAAATAAALRAVLDEGLALHVGVSNYSLDRWRALEDALGAPVLTNQVRFSLLDRRPERELLDWAQAHGRIVIAYSPLAQGLLSGRYDADHRPSGLRAATAAFLPENLRAIAGLVEVLREVAAVHDVTPAQIALAWLLGHRNVVVIPGASSVAQAERNAESADIELSSAEHQALVDAADAYRPVGGVPAVVRGRAEVATRRVRRALAGLRA
jgi:aryl-alcohol dehydrogenase-like predicted oxidoreductase